MLNATVLMLTGWALAVIAVSQLVMVLVAFAYDENGVMRSFMLAALITFFSSAALITGFRGRHDRVGRSETTVLVLLIWLGLPIFAAAPFFTSGAIGSLTGAYFEAVSGLTTTGASVINKLDEMPRTIILWRACLHGVGGALSLLTAVLLLAPFDAAVSPVKSTVPGYEQGDLPKSVISTAVDILPIYLAFILFSFAGLWLTNLPALDAMVYALSASSTGGFSATDGGLASYKSPLAEAIICVAMLAGATSFLAHRADLIRQPSGGHKDVYESRTMFIIVIVAAIIFTIITVLEERDNIDEPTSFLNAMRYGTFRAISLISTTGLDNAPLAATTAPFVLVLGLIVIGGAAFSTASGIKIFRISMLMAQAHRELKRLIHPRAVTRAYAAGKSFNIQTLKPVWALLFVFLFAAGAIALVISSQGESYETSLMAAIAALSNAGPAMGIALGEGGSIHSYATMNGISKMTLALGMVLGRLEFLAILGLVGWFWHNRI